MLKDVPCETGNIAEVKMKLNCSSKPSIECGIKMTKMINASISNVSITGSSWVVS